jgi:hypothetical protein
MTCTHRATILMPSVHLFNYFENHEACGRTIFGVKYVGRLFCIVIVPKIFYFDKYLTSYYRDVRRNAYGFSCKVSIIFALF